MLRDNFIHRYNDHEMSNLLLDYSAIILDSFRRIILEMLYPDNPCSVKIGKNLAFIIRPAACVEYVGSLHYIIWVFLWAFC